jgi:hypothetical protein
MPHATHPVTVRTRWLTIGEGGMSAFAPPVGGKRTLSEPWLASWIYEYAL